MLLQTLLLVAIFAIAGASLLIEGLYAAKIAEHVAAERSAAAASDRQIDEVTAALRTAIQASGNSGVLPTQAVSIPASPACISDARPCNLIATGTWQIIGQANAGLAGVTPQSFSIAENVLHGVIDESRITVVVSTEISLIPAAPAASQTALATKIRYVTYRTLNNWPYSTLTGVRDSSNSGATGLSAAGDAAGQSRLEVDVPAPMNRAPASYHDTRLSFSISCEPNMGLNGLSPTDGLHWGAGTDQAFQSICDSKMFAYRGAQAPYEAYSQAVPPQRWLP